MLQFKLKVQDCLNGTLFATFKIYSKHTLYHDDIKPAF